MNKTNILLGIGITCMMVGFIVAWPLVCAATMYSTVWAKVLTVLVIPVDETHSRVSFAYEFRISGNGPHQGNIVLCYNLADERLQLVDDPVVSNDIARRTQQQYEDRSVRVYVDMNRPDDSAFMLNPLNQERPIRPEQGALLVMLGICCSILAQMNRIRR